MIIDNLGEERRRDVAERLKSGNFDPKVWGEWLTDSKLDDNVRKLIGSRHPRFMGGEYLPVLSDNEIEIARIVLASVTQDVISVRARKDGARIHYSVHDQYESEFVRSRRSSKRPLSLRELIKFIDESEYQEALSDGGLAWSHILWHLDEGFVDDVRHFVRVESAFYPELGSYYTRVIGDFFAELEAESHEDDLHEDEGLHEAKHASH